MSYSDATVAVVHESEYVGLVFRLKVIYTRVVRVLLLVRNELGLQSIGVEFGASTQVHFLWWCWVSASRQRAVQYTGRPATHGISEE